jgi:uncharacterized protein YndB with AHSA1/START domain
VASLHFERVYPHPPERVWRALTEPELLERWLMPNDFAPQVGHRFTFRTDPAPGFDGVVHCEVLELEPPRRLAFTWQGGPLDTVVRFTLSPDAAGTRLQMEQTGFRGVKAWLVSRILKGGFRTMYGRKLPAVLESLEAGGAPRPEAPQKPEACMERSQTWIGRLLGWLERRKK